MATVRVIPPAAGDTVTVNGRYYVGVSGVAQDVPSFDAQLLNANGWIILDSGGSGTTAQRPTGLGLKDAGLEYSDTTLGYSVVFDGVNWCNFSGAHV